jgi:hypothetical protein
MFEEKFKQFDDSNQNEYIKKIDNKDNTLESRL